jgi:hypothetical protein
MELLFPKPMKLNERILQTKTIYVVVPKNDWVTLAQNESESERERKRELCCQVTEVMSASVTHELPFACSWITLIFDATIWLHGDRPANTCISPTFLWIMVPAHHMPYPRSQPHWGGKAPLSGGYAVQYECAIQGKDDGIQVLAGLAPSSQTVGANIKVICEQVKRSSWMTEVTEANIAPATLEPSTLSLSLTHTHTHIHTLREHNFLSLRTHLVCANVASGKCH